MHWRLNRSFGFTVVLILVIRVVGMGTGFVQNVVIANILGPSGYGQIAFGLALLAVLQVISVVGLDNYSSRIIGTIFPSKPNKQWMYLYLKQSHRIIIPFSLIISILCGGVFFLINHYVSPSILLATIALPVSALCFFYESVLRGLSHPGLGSIPNRIVRPFIIICLLITSVFINSVTIDTVIVMIWIGILCSFIVAGCSLVKIVSRLNTFNRACSSKFTNGSEISSLKCFFNNFIVFFAVSTIGVLLNKADIVILGFILSDSDVGQYAAAYNLSFLLVFALQAINYVVSPKLARLYAQQEIKKLKRLYKQIRLSSLLFALPMFLVFQFIPEIALKIYGGEFSNGSFILRILAVGMFANAFFGPVGNLLMMSGYESIWLRILFLGFLLQVGLLVLLVPHFKLIIAPIIVSFTMIVWNVSAWIYIHYKIKIF